MFFIVIILIFVDIDIDETVQFTQTVSIPF